MLQHLIMTLTSLAQGWTRFGLTRGSGRVGSKFPKCIIFFFIGGVK